MMAENTVEQQPNIYISQIMGITHEVAGTSAEYDCCARTAVRDAYQKKDAVICRATIRSINRDCQEGLKTPSGTRKQYLVSTGCIS